VSATCSGSRPTGPFKEFGPGRQLGRRHAAAHLDSLRHLVEQLNRDKERRKEKERAETEEEEEEEEEIIREQEREETVHQQSAAVSEVGKKQK
jgi:hypothetical protein